MVLGFIGMVTLGPWIKSVFHLPTGLTALTGSVMLAFMAMPTIVSIAEDAINSVPEAVSGGGLALGATHWQTTRLIVARAARPGMVARSCWGSAGSSARPWR